MGTDKDDVDDAVTTNTADAKGFYTGRAGT